MLLSIKSASLTIAFALFACISLLPVAVMLAESFSIQEGPSLSNYTSIIMDARQQVLLKNSVILSTAAALLATLLGAGLGFVLARMDLRYKRLLRFLLVIPLLVPPYILGVVWIFVSGRNGLIARLIGYDLISDWTYSLIGASIVMTLALFPLPMLITEAALRRINTRLEEAALISASGLRVLLRITLPLIARAVFAGALLVFILTIAEFGVPALLRVRVFATEVFTQFAAFFNFGAATAVATPLILSTLVVALLARPILSEEISRQRMSGWGSQRLRVTDRWKMAALMGTVLVLLVATILPVLALGVQAAEVSGLINQVRSSSSEIFNSISLSAIVATLAIAIGLMLGYARAQTRWRGLIDVLMIAIFATPSTIIGIGLINIWNRPGLFSAVYGSWTIVVIAHLARLIPVAALILSGYLAQMPRSAEEAADVAGSGWWRTLTRIIIPMNQPGIVAAWIVIFIFSFGELGATVLVSPAGSSTLPVRIYTIMANSTDAVVAALCLIQIVATLIPLVMLMLIAQTKILN